MRRVWFSMGLTVFMSVAVLVGGLLPLCAEEEASPQIAGDISILTNRDYFPAVHELLQEAESSIEVMMFSARYYEEKPRFAGDIEHIPGTHWSNTNVLMDDLVEAQERGVDVKMILDSSSWNESNTELNENFGQLLVEAGVAVYMDDPEVTTHTKLIVVDDDMTVVGSTNWSYYALDTNNETSVLIRSKEINKSYREFISQVLAKSTPLSMTEGN